MADKINTIPDMLGGRVRKRRMTSDHVPSKRAKTATNAAAVAPSVVAAAKPAPAPVAASPAPKPAEAGPSSPAPKASPSTPAKARKPSTRQLRLSELLKKDRQERHDRSAPSPTIVKGAPHMDSRRPTPSSRSTPPKRLFDAEVSLCTPERPSKAAAVEEQTSSESSAEKLQQVTPRSVPTRSGDSVDSVVTPASKLTSTRVRASGSEAITYARSMLPTSHLLLLDIFAGIETAANLLKTRQELMTFGAVSTVVRKNSKRDFTFRSLSQLAHLIPEALAVLPSRNPRNTGREHFVLRLDSVDKKTVDGPVNTSFVSLLGGGATRARRRMLHDRLLDHVREHHKAFLKTQGIKAFESNMWHDEFDLETDVPQLGAPPLYPMQLPAIVSTPKKSAKKVAKSVSPAKNAAPVAEPTESPKSDATGDGASCIPTSLLERVRARSAARQASVLAKNQDHRTNPDFLERLPATMDAVVSILRNDKRQAFGWGQLIGRLVKSHPRKWEREELERQLTTITEIADEWCSKVALSSGKGRFAFRVLDEKKFSSQRAKVASKSA